MKKSLKQKFVSLLLCCALLFSLLVPTSCEVLNALLVSQAQLNEIAKAISKQEIETISLSAEAELKTEKASSHVKESFTYLPSTGDFDLYLPSENIYAFYRDGHLFRHTESYAYTPTSFTRASYVEPSYANFLVFKNSAFFNTTEYEAGDVLGQTLFGVSGENVGVGNLKDTFAFFRELGCISLKKTTLTIDLQIFFDRFVDDLYAACSSVKSDTTLGDLAKHKNFKKYVDLIEKTATEKNKQAFEAQLKEALKDYGVSEDLWSTNADELLKKAVHKNWKDKLKEWTRTVTDKEFLIEEEDGATRLFNSRIVFSLNKDQTLSSLSTYIQGEVDVKVLDYSGWKTETADLNVEVTMKVSPRTLALADLSNATIRAYEGDFDGSYTFKKTISPLGELYIVKDCTLEDEYVYEGDDQSSPLGVSYLNVSAIIDHGEITSVKVVETTQLNSQGSTHEYPAFTFEDNVLTTEYQGAQKRYRLEFRNNTLYAYKITEEGETEETTSGVKTAVYGAINLHGKISDSTLTDCTVTAYAPNFENVSWGGEVNVPAVFSKETNTLTFTWNGVDYRYEFDVKIDDAPFSYPSIDIIATGNDDTISFEYNISVPDESQDISIDEYISRLNKYYAKS